MNWTQEEKDYMDYLDDVNCEGYGLLLGKGDPIAFQVGLNEWLMEIKNDKSQDN